MNLTIPEEFPISEKERQLIKKKLLMFLAWCHGENSCITGKARPFLSTCKEKGRVSYEDIVSWIMEADID